MGKDSGGNRKQGRAGAGTLAGVEAKIKNSDVEHLYIFGADGSLLGSTVGTSDEVDTAGLPPGIQLKDAVVTHNHPMAGRENLYEYAPSLSQGDVNQAIKDGVAEIRAVGDRYTYSLKIAPSVRGDRKFRDSVMEKITEVKFDLGDEFAAMPKKQRDTVKMHRVMEGIAAAFPGQLTYTRSKS